MNKNIYRLGVVIFALISSPLQSFGDDLKIYIIRSRLEIDWTSPRTLALSAGYNTAIHDLEPLGHFAVEVNCSAPNKYGFRHFLSGMGRKNTKDVDRLVRDSGMGLGSLTYPFQGRLETAEETKSSIIDEIKMDHVRILKIPTSPARCNEMMDFLTDWIENGSYTVYGGGKNAEQGEGAGCADFAESFFKIATGQPFPDEWKIRVKIPQSLIGTKNNRVSLSSVVLKGDQWATSEEPHQDFGITDPGKAFEWIRARLKPGLIFYAYDLSFALNEPTLSDPSARHSFTDPSAPSFSLPALPRKPFIYRYSTEESANVVFSEVSR